MTFRDRRSIRQTDDGVLFEANCSDCDKTVNLFISKKKLKLALKMIKQKKREGVRGVPIEFKSGKPVRPRLR